MLKIADREFKSRLFTGTGKFANKFLMEQAIKVSGSQLATMALKRVDIYDQQDDILQPLIEAGVHLLPNTSGAKNAKDAVFAAHLAREALGTNWLKLEIHPDPKYLMPDPIETLAAAEQLVKDGFTVLPYCHADPVLCKRLEEVGCAAVMPLGSPIGSNKGIVSHDFLEIIIDQANVPVVVDAGIGALLMLRVRWKWVQTPYWSILRLQQQPTRLRWRLHLKWPLNLGEWRMRPV